MNGAIGDIRALFQQATSLPSAQLASFLDSLDASTRTQLEALLAADARAQQQPLETAINAELDEYEQRPQRFGAFETTKLLGRGGMGAVFLARRVDGVLHQEVAIKVVTGSWFDPRANDRFGQERQILAGLSHPNIARLIDGGTRPDGIAYLAMEYVPGERIDRYCEEYALDTPAKLRLFLPLCSAVDHAHRKLIIHRDLKPSNVLVTPEGQPKLLDFGIAKALDSNLSTATQTIAFTPDFASPEQTSGGELTTATDVYGLGAILHFLLTGKAPHRGAPSFGNDLDSILGKALHPEPTRRYESALALAADIERYLERRPVLATPDSGWYRLRKFIARNALATAAAALAVVSAITGTAVSLYQAHLARENFNQVRELASSFIFDFEASVRDTPGTLQARKKMAATAREYLARLERQNSSDPQLLRELAASHYRLAAIEGDTQETKLRIDDLNKAAAILRRLGDDRHGTPAQRALFVDVEDETAQYWGDTDPQKMIAPAEEALSCAQELYAAYPNDLLSLRALVRTKAMKASALYDVHKIKESVPWISDAADLGQKALQSFPHDPALAYRVVDAKNRLGTLVGAMGDHARAVQAVTDAIAILDRMPPADRNSPQWWHMRLNFLANRCAQTRRLAGERPEMEPTVLPLCKEMYDMAHANLARDPGNRRVLDQAYVMITRYALQLAVKDRASESLAALDEAGGILDTLDTLRPIDHRALSLRANYLANRTDRLRELKRWPEAELACRQSEGVIAKVLAELPDDIDAISLKAENLTARAALEERRGFIEAARDHTREALHVAQQVIQLRKDVKSPPSAFPELREIAARLKVPDITKTAP